MWGFEGGFQIGFVRFKFRARLQLMAGSYALQRATPGSNIRLDTRVSTHHLNVLPVCSHVQLLLWVFRHICKSNRFPLKCLCPTHNTKTQRTNVSPSQHRTSSSSSSSSSSYSSSSSSSSSCVPLFRGAGVDYSLSVAFRTNCLHSLLP